MKGAPLVSVIVPCFNQARFLPDCLASLQAQTYPRWEAVIINDGSSDNTREVARRYAERDSRFKYLEQENRGLAATRNRGLRDMAGDYVQFLDSDDVIAAEKFEVQIAALSAAPDAGLAFCDYLYGTEEDISRGLKTASFCRPRFQMRRPIEDLASRWETSLSIPIHCFLFDARLFREHGILFDERLASYEDWDCWMRIFALNPRIERVKRELAVYRKHAGSMSGDIPQMRRAFRAAVKAQLLLCGKDAVLRRLLVRKRLEMELQFLRRIWARRLAPLRRRGSR